MFVIKWRYYDGSSSGIIPYIFSKLGMATRFKEILDEHGCRGYEIEEIKVFEGDENDTR